MAACSVGGGGDAGGGGGGGGGPVQGGVDDPNQANGVTCSADVTINGTFTQSTPPPTGTGTTPSCWPIGAWSFTAAVAKNNGCTPAPTMLGSYSFTVALTDASDGSGQTQTMTSTTTTPSGMQTHLEVSATGQGCTAIFELGSADGKDYWNLQPVLDKGTTTLTGTGEYDEYASNNWPWPAN